MKYRMVVDLTHKEWFELEADSDEEAKELVEKMSNDIEQYPPTCMGSSFISDVRIVDKE